MNNLRNSYTAPGNGCRLLHGEIGIRIVIDADDYNVDC